jgi:transposase
MSRSKRYPKEFRERSVALVLEHQGEHSSQWACIESISAKSGMTPETLRRWVRQAEIDGGSSPGLTTDEKQQIKELKRENRELRRTNEILKAASAFFARELDPGPPKK